jgi:signal transduction histidine kinase
MAQSTVLQAGITFVLSAALAVYVAMLRPHTHLRAVVLGLLASFMAWSAGLVLIHGVGDDPVLARAGALVVMAGVMTASPLWLFMCARLARVSAVIDRPRAALLALLTPSVLVYTAAATDDLHGLFAGGKTLEMFTQPALDWAGPFFWVHATWGYLCGLAGIVLCARAALGSCDSVERVRLGLVALAVSVPAVSVGLSLAGVVPPTVRLTPGDLSVSAMLLVAAIVRYRFLEPGPLPAKEVIAHLREAFVLADGAGRVVDANPAAEALLDRSVHALRGISLRDVVGILRPDLGLPDEVCRVPGRVRTQTLVTGDGRVLDVSWVHLIRAEGETLGSFLIAHDRTDQHRAEHLRHRSQRLESLGVLAAGIAHEINNPLAFVRGNLAHLERLAILVAKRLDAYEPAEADELREMGEVILETQGGAERISRIVDATRRLSREPGAAREAVDVNAVADEALQMAALHSNRGVEIETRLTSQPPRVQGSAAQLGQVILNLLINAKQAAGSQHAGRIRLETDVRDGWVELRVHDDGPGVSPELRERVFDPFYTTKGPDEGTGLGLAIAFDIAEDHGGELDVGESALGGACFTLRLPAEG